MAKCGSLVTHVYNSFIVSTKYNGVDLTVQNFTVSLSGSSNHTGLAAIVYKPRREYKRLPAAIEVD